jgi:hypothetical protein
MSKLASVIVFLGVAFLLALAGVGGTYMAQQQERERLADFASDSAAGTGTITRKFTEVMTGNTLFYDLEASFAAADGVTHKQSFRVPPDIYNRYGLGSSVPVTYVKSKPFLFYIPGGEPDAGNPATLGTMNTWFFRASVVLSIGFLVSLCLAMMARSSGGGGDIAPQPAPAPMRQTSGYGRSGFGARQARR